jgi:hypothetical protein
MRFLTTNHVQPTYASFSKAKPQYISLITFKKHSGMNSELITYLKKKKYLFRGRRTGWVFPEFWVELESASDSN